MPTDAIPGADEIGAPELPKPAPRPDCECDGYPGAMCGCWRARTTTTKETA